MYKNNGDVLVELNSSWAHIDNCRTLFVLPSNIIWVLWTERNTIIHICWLDATDTYVTTAPYKCSGSSNHIVSFAASQHICDRERWPCIHWWPIGWIHQIHTNTYTLIEQTTTHTWIIGVETDIKHIENERWNGKRNNNKPVSRKIYRGMVFRPRAMCECCIWVGISYMSKASVCVVSELTFMHEHNMLAWDGEAGWWGHVQYRTEHVN